MISIPEAFAAIVPAFLPLPTERVALGDALGRFLAAPLHAREDVPPFDNSAMDGYALRAADVPGTLPVHGEARAGGPWPEALTPGAAMRIFTGAPLPDGADAIVLQEDATRRGDEVEIPEASSPGRHVRRRGEVLRVGDVVLDAGARLGPGEIAALASQGHALVGVHRRPRVAILSTGDELREIGAPARPGSLVDSNAHGLAAAVRDAGAVPVVLPLGADDLSALERAVGEGLASADVLVTTGGVSVGDYDLLHEAFARAGVEARFWKVRLKPGKPVRFGVAAGGAPVLGLPGNPVSALVTFDLFVRPGLRRMLGDREPFRPLVEVTLGFDARCPESRTELARARFDADGRAVPTARQGSAVTTSMIDPDLLVVLPQGGGALPAGARARAIDLKTTRGSADHGF